MDSWRGVREGDGHVTAILGPAVEPVHRGVEPIAIASGHLGKQGLRVRRQCAWSMAAPSSVTPAKTTAISGPPRSDLPLLGRPDRRLRCIAGIVASAWRWAVRKPRRVAAHLGRRRERHPCGPQAAGRVPRISLRVSGYEPSFGSPRNSAGVQINNRGSPNTNARPNPRPVHLKGSRGTSSTIHSLHSACGRQKG